MWVCGYCHRENKDAASSCISCGRQKLQRRFASAPARSLQYANAQEEIYGEPRVSAAPKAAQTPYPPTQNGYDDTEANHAATRVMPMPRPLACGFARVVGILLCIGLPLLVGALAWGQYAALSEALVPLFIKESSPSWAQLLVYIVLCLFAALLSLLPGLWTLLRIPAKRNKREEPVE